jgi:hypothetical protein
MIKINQERRGEQTHSSLNLFKDWDLGDGHHNRAGAGHRVSGVGVETILLNKMSVPSNIEDIKSGSITEVDQPFHDYDLNR